MIEYISPMPYFPLKYIFTDLQCFSFKFAAPFFVFPEQAIMSDL